MFSFGVGGVWWVIFSSVPPSPQQTGISVEALKSRGESGRNPPLQAPKGRETPRDSPLAAFGILTVAAPWRKSWRANWVWGWR